MPKTTVNGPVLSGPLTTTERKGYVVSAIAIPFTCSSLPTVASAGTLVGYLPANTSIISAVVNQTATTDLGTEYVQLGFTATAGNPGQYDCTYAQLTGVGVRFITLYDANVNKAKWRDVGTTRTPLYITMDVASTTGSGVIYLLVAIGADNYDAP